MEQVLEVYKRPYNRKHPVVCMDETPRQLIRETRTPIPGAQGRLERHDYEYERCGVFNVFMANEPLAGKRMTKVTERKTKSDWAEFIREIEGHYKNAKKITLVMDNLNTHKPGSLYETFPPEEAKRIRDRFEFIYTPKHGSWLDMAEYELAVLAIQCLNRRIPDKSTLIEEVAAWLTNRNKHHVKADWRFTTDDARVKLKRLYPQFQ